MKNFVLILSSIFSCLGYAGNCTGEIEKVTSEMTFEELIELVEKEGEGYDTVGHALRSIGTIADFRRDNQFYLSNSQFNRITAYFNGGVLEGEFTGLYFSGTTGLSSPFGLFIGFDNKSCKLRSVSYDVPL